VRWVEDVEADAVVAAARAVVVVEAKGVVPLPQDRAATAFAPVVGIRNRMQSASRVTRRNVPSAAHR
jgi:hypothetical protein